MQSNTTTNKSTMENRSWDVEKLVEYFATCQKPYLEFISMSDQLMKAFQAFVDDEEHKGEEADKSKAFIEDRQIPLLVDITDDIQLLQELEQGLLEAFATDVDAAANAIIKTEFLDKVALDFDGYKKNTLKIRQGMEMSLKNKLQGRYSYKDM